MSKSRPVITFKALKAKREAAQKLVQDPNITTEIRAQLASTAPPLGPQLGQRGVNVANFCKDFNAQTANIKNGAIMPVSIHVKPDRTYDLDIGTPTTGWLLFQAAGTRRPKQKPDEVVGWLSVKHIYEIAKIKSHDKTMIGVPMKEICQLVIQRARQMGFRVQYEDLEPDQLQQFLDAHRAKIQADIERKAQYEAAKLART